MNGSLYDFRFILTNLAMQLLLYIIIRGDLMTDL